VCGTHLFQLLIQRLYLLALATQLFGRFLPQVELLLKMPHILFSVCQLLTYRL
jgi:hypothetical protein